MVFVFLITSGFGVMITTGSIAFTAADCILPREYLLTSDGFTQMYDGVVGQNFQLSTHVISNPLPGSDPQGFHQVRTLTHNIRAPHPRDEFEGS